MKKLSFKRLTLIITLIVFSGQVLALKCGHRIVDEGDTKTKVFLRCGEPDFIETREQRVPRNCVRRDYMNNYGYYDSYRYQGCGITVVDIWTYNFGPTKFMRELIFLDGILDKINTLEYGYR